MNTKFQKNFCHYARLLLIVTFGVIAQLAHAVGHEVESESVDAGHGNHVIAPNSFDVAVPAAHGQHHVMLTSAIAAESGVITAVAGAGILQQQLTFLGRVTHDPKHVRHLSARFPGLIHSVKTQLGDQVQVGDVLAIIESDESLRRYNVTAPIAGMVVAQHAKGGESTGHTVLFTLANSTQLIATFAVFPQDAALVKVGQPVLVKGRHSQITSVISALTPGESNAPTMTAWASFENAVGKWTPGEWISADVTVAEFPTPLLIDNRALQTVQGRQVVFVQMGDSYERRALELGRSDGRFTEVLGGLKSGESYVVENSYLLKAELEKSGAAHDH